jgi:hypothetical protein
MARARVLRVVMRKLKSIWHRRLTTVPMWDFSFLALQFISNSCCIYLTCPKLDISPRFLRIAWMPSEETVMRGIYTPNDTKQMCTSLSFFRGSTALCIDQSLQRHESFGQISWSQKYASISLIHQEYISLILTSCQTTPNATSLCYT